ncbi:MAG TPA: serine/threonine-protein kinase, partial [Polyangiaceae bacterium]|nr:serine/threonine-protein kinase [Polyangiaceae bacterium]
MAPRQRFRRAEHTPAWRSRTRSACPAGGTSSRPRGPAFDPGAPCDGSPGIADRAAEAHRFAARWGARARPCAAPRPRARPSVPRRSGPGRRALPEAGTERALSPGVTPEVGCIVANRFELVRELGRGSMGTVWLANHLTLKAPCAVKFMTSEATRDPAYAARFELEAQAIARLSSPNVVRVIDFDMHEGVPFIAMECLKGEDLGARLRRVGKLDAASTYRIISQVAHGLAKAHAAGIIHRDLKPDNIFLAEEDEGEVAKLVDFGIAKLTGFAAQDKLSSSTQAGSLIGTPAYMSPEQARGVTDLDHRSDLWSLAVIAFECVTGRLPFDSASLGDLFAKILFEPIPVPSDVAPDSAPRTLDRWWTHAAARAVEDRYGTALELADALGRALGVVKDETRETLRARAWESAKEGS